MTNHANTGAEGFYGIPDDPSLGAELPHWALREHPGASDPNALERAREVAREESIISNILATAGVSHPAAPRSLEPLDHPQAALACSAEQAAGSYAYARALPTNKPVVVEHVPPLSVVRTATAPAAGATTSSRQNTAPAPLAPDAQPSEKKATAAAQPTVPLHYGERTQEFPAVRDERERQAAQHIERIHGHIMNVAEAIVGGKTPDQLLALYQHDMMEARTDAERVKKIDMTSIRITASVMQSANKNRAIDRATRVNTLSPALLGVALGNALDIEYPNPDEAEAQEGRLTEAVESALEDMGDYLWAKPVLDSMLHVARSGAPRRGPISEEDAQLLSSNARILARHVSFCCGSEGRQIIDRIRDNGLNLNRILEGALYTHGRLETPNSGEAEMFAELALPALRALDQEAAHQQQMRRAIIHVLRNGPESIDSDPIYKGKGDLPTEWIRAGEGRKNVFFRALCANWCGNSDIADAQFQTPNGPITFAHILAAATYGSRGIKSFDEVQAVVTEAITYAKKRFPVLPKKQELTPTARTTPQPASQREAAVVAPYVPATHHSTSASSIRQPMTFMQHMDVAWASSMRAAGLPFKWAAKHAPGWAWAALFVAATVPVDVTKSAYRAITKRPRHEYRDFIY